MMMQRRDFLRKGSLWVAGALVAEPHIKRLWAFPNNPVSAPVRYDYSNLHGLSRSMWGGWDIFIERLCPSDRVYLVSPASNGRITVVMSRMELVSNPAWATL